jgi:HK97 family phage major capsid protein/HK97 family phage prohead protease
MESQVSPNRPTAGSVEERQAPAVAVDGRRLRGVIPYGVESRDMGGWREVIEPGALRSANLDSLVATVDHAGLPLGRYPTTLELEDRAEGAHWSVEPPSSRPDVREAVERGDLRAGSWRMIVGREEWRGDVRHVHEISELRDVSVVTDPAYPAASVELRSAENVENNEGGERRQKEGTMPEENTGAADEQRAKNENTDEVEERSTERVENTEETTEERTEGGLRVEDRNERPASSQDVEARVVEAIRGVRKGETRSLSLTSAAAIAPAELSSFLFEKMRASSVALRSGIVVIPTDRKEIHWPKLSADVAPDWYKGGAEITPGDPTLKALEATPKKLAHLVQVENEVIDDSEPSVVDVLNNHLGTMLGLKLDLGIFEGDPEAEEGNENEITGMLKIEGIQHTEKPESYDPFVKAVGLLQEANAPGPYVAVGPPSVFTALALLKDKNEAQLAPPREMPQLFPTTQVEATFVYAPSQIVLVRRSSAEIELDRSRLFHKDESEIRGKARADLLLPNPEAVVVLDE